MAKDRDKLFKGVDDKAITFQRAVFIVCNLRRLIKRPKKDEKQAANGSRKRSGACGGSSSGGCGDDEDDATSSAQTQRGRKGQRRGDKEPVRRAFTLPAMLCGTFGLVAPVLATTSTQRRDQVSSTSGQENAAITSQAANGPSNTVEVQLARFAQEQQACCADEGMQTVTASPLSCLATPVRRALGTANQNSRYEQASTCPDYAQPPPSYHATTAAKRTVFAAEPAEQSGARQICCPVWLQLMNDLDANQRQPREQSQHVHLIGAPSAQSYLVAPVLSSPLGDPHAAGEQPPQVLISGVGGGCDEEAAAAAAAAAARRQELLHQQQNQFRRSSDESAEKNVHRKNQHHHHHHQEQLNIGPDDCHKQQDPGSPSSDVGPSGQQQQRTRQIKNRTEVTGRPNNNQHLQHHLDIDKMRMKRFSSALCLNDQSLQQQQHQHQEQQQQLEAESSDANKQFAQALSGNQSLTGAARKAALLAPEDPTMALARQRRPSASNQGSVNVEQQALFSAVECNQLERARSILEEGKANVNCLNGDKLTCLDIAVFMRHIDMVKLLQQYNAKESSAYLTREGRANQLYALYMEARRLVEDLSRSLQAIAPQQNNPSSQQQAMGHTTNYQQPSTINRDQSQPNVPLMLATGSLLSTALFEEKQRQLQYWKRRLDLFMHMRYQFERLQVPNAPELIVLQVVGEQSLGVKIVHSLKSNSSASFANVNQSLANLQDSYLLASDGADQFANNPQQQQQQQQQQQRYSATNAHQLLLSLPRCLQGPSCSHWQLAEFCAAADWQQQQIRAQRSDLNTGMESTRSNSSSAWTSRQQQQQKLAVFNQLLAHQLKLLSYQQHQQLQMQMQMQMQMRPNSSSHSRVPVMGASSSDSESIGSHQSLEHGSQMMADQFNQPSIAYQLITSASHLQRQSNLLQQQQQHQASIGGAGSSSQCSDSLATSGGRILGAIGGLKFCHNNADDASRCSDTAVIITKYKIEWSLNEQMDPILNSMIVYNNNLYPLECQISGLINGQLYYVQVSSGNHKGFCEPRPTSPICLAPSSWRQVDGNKRRRCDEEVFRKFTKLILLNKHILDDHQACNSSLASSSANCTGLSLVGASPASSGSGGGSGQQSKSNLINMLLLDATTPTGDQLRRETQLVTSGEDEQQQQQQQQQSSTSMRKNLKNFFQSNSFKFHKLNNQNKRGLYLTTVVYYTAPNTKPQHQLSVSGLALNQPLPSSSNDKIVVTNDDRLPIIEVLNDLVAPAALMSDFYWLLKINGTQWMDIKRLRQQLQKSHSSSTLHLRIKLLVAIEQMQLALNMEDIGRLFYKPIQAHDGSIVICTCRRVPNTKMVSSLSIKWTHQHKIIPRHLRKISDSMLNNAEQSRASTSTENRPSGPRDWRTGSQVCHLRTNLEPGGDRFMQQTNANGDFRNLCESCQYQLIQRRSTMASGSSNSSLASSNESQWSVGGVSNGCNLTTGSCQCRSGTTSAGNRSNSSITTISGPSFLLSAPNSQRGSTCTASTCTTTTTGGGSGGGSKLVGPMGTPTHGSTTLSIGGAGGGSISLGSASISSAAGLSGRNSSQPFTAAQKSSTYLMLASLSLYDLLLFHMNEIIYFDQTSTRPLKRGLYLGFVQLQTTVESMRLLVPRLRPNMVPNARIRDNAHVSREEWQLLKRFANSANSSCNKSSPSINRSPTTTAAQSVTPKPGNAGAGETGEGGSKSMHLDTSFAQQSTEQRNRAKSVSPGSIEAAANQEAAAAAVAVASKVMADESLQMGQSRSSEQIPSQHHSTSEASVNSLLLRPTNHSISQQVNSGCDSPLSPSRTASQAHSDTDLNLVLKTTMATTRRRQRHLSQNAPDSTSSQVETPATATTVETNPTCSDPSLNLSPSLSMSHQISAVATDNYLKSKAPSKSGSTFGSRLAVFTAGSGTGNHQTAEETFVRLVGSAARRLLAELNGHLPRVYDEQTNSMVSILQSLNDEENNRIYHLELIELSNQVSFILLLPAPENVCPVTSHEKSNILGDNKEYMLLPLQIFETIHINTYEPDLLGKYSRLSAILETDLVVAQHDHRQAFSSNELKSTKSRVSNLQEMVTIADEFWRKLRWIVDVVSFARDKSQNGSNGIKLGTIWRYFELTPSPSSSHYHYQTTQPQTRRCSNASGGSQLQVVVEPKQLVAAGPRSGFEVKRTASAKTTGGRLSEADLMQRVTTYEEKAASLTVMDSVPEIHLPMTAGWQQQQQQQQQRQPVDGTGKLSSQTSSQQVQQNQNVAKSTNSQLNYGRRHSGGPAVGLGASTQAAPVTTTSCKTILGDRQVELVRSRVQQCIVSVKRHHYDSHPQQSSSNSDSVDSGPASGHRNRGSTTSNCHTDDCDGESLIDLQLQQTGDGGSEDEENAIYAYHLSLKDATRAAAQRKCSQQSTRPIVPSDEVPTTTTTATDSHRRPTVIRKSSSKEKLEHQQQLLATSCDWAFSPNSSDVSTPSSSSRSSMRHHHHLNHHRSQHHQHHHRQTRPTTAMSRSGDKESGGDNSSGSGSTIKQRSATSSGGSRKRRQFKSTNPFLTDSFDLVQENQDPGSDPRGAN